MALRAECASEEALNLAQSSMALLNKRAAEILAEGDVWACTDITGFGLAGHAAEMVDGAPCGLKIRYADLPLIPGVEEWAAMGLVPEGTFRNKQGRMRFIENVEALDPVMLDILFDPQTSGGLLAAIPADRATQGAGRLEGPGSVRNRDRRDRWEAGHRGDPRLMLVLATFPVHPRSPPG